MENRKSIAYYRLAKLSNVLTMLVYGVNLDEDCISLDCWKTKDGLTLVVLGSHDSITCGFLETKEEDPSLKFYLNKLKVLNHSVSVQHVAISPITNLTELPRKMVFATAGSDFAMRIYKTDLSDDESCEFFDLKGHKSYVNAISFDATYGQYLASTSDDHTCRLWSTETGSCISVYALTSPGAAVCWHPDEPMKLLVAEKGGMVRLYDVATHRVVRTIDATSVAPVLTIDWDQKNKSRVAVGASSCCYVWNLSRPSRPEESRKIHNETVAKIAFGRLGDYFASLGYPGPTVRIIGEDFDIESTPEIQVGKSLRSHPTLPYMIVNSLRKILLWRVPVEAP